MLQKNKKTLIFSSLAILLPLLAGVILWNRLPESVAVHFAADGQANGFSSKAFSVFGMPLIILALHWLCIFATCASPKSEKISSKVMSLVLWICPSISVLMGSIIYAHALNFAFSVPAVCSLFIGFLFIVIGNFLPKCEQNYVIGIKISWTLNSEENWNRTHRFAGRLWVICGIIILLTAFWDKYWIFGILTALAVILPFAFSYRLHRKSTASKSDS